jgi:hypothetical protein
MAVLSRRAVRCAIALAAGVALYALVGFLLLPALIRWQLEKQLPGLTRRAASVREVRMNPFALSLTVRGLTLSEPDGARFASFEELYANLELASLVRRGLVLKELRLLKPFAEVIWRADGSFNFDDLRPPPAAEPAPPSPPRPLPPVTVQLLRLEDGVLAFADYARPKPFEDRFEPINLRLTDFTTVADRDSPHRFVAVTPRGARIEWTGSVSVNPPRSAGSLALMGLPLSRFSSYSEDAAGLEIADGTLGFALQYQAAYLGGAFSLQVREGTLDLADLRVRLPAEQAELALAGAALRGVEASAAAEQTSVRLGSLALRGVDARAGPRTLALQELALEGVEASVDDQTARADALRLAGVQGGEDANTAKLDRASVEQLAADLRARALRAAAVQLEGIAAQARPSPSTRAELQGLTLAIRQPDLSLGERRIAIEEVALRGAQAQLALVATPPTAPGSGAAAAPPAAEPPAGATPPRADAAGPAAASPPPAEPPLDVRVGAVVLEGLALRFSDESIQPAVSTGIERLGGRITGLSSDPGASARVDLSGRVGAHAPLRISGRINPLAPSPTLDLRVALKHWGLSPTSPYSARYVGYQLDRGALSLDLHYRVARQELDARNKLRVDQLNLGAASGSPDALKIPIKLALALLQDRHGIIDLDVPVSGRLDDPSFRLGKVIVQALVNLLTKAATSPFSALGGLLGISADDLGWVAFEPGSSDFLSEEIRKLDALATGLQERPGLVLAIAGGVDRAADREALARSELERRIRERRLAELPADERAAPGAAESVSLTPAERERILSALHAEAGAAGGAPSEPTAGAEAAATEASVAQLEQRLLAGMAISDDQLRALGHERAEKVQAYLRATGRVQPEQLRLAAPGGEAAAQGSRAALSVEAREAGASPPAAPSSPSAPASAAAQRTPG